MWEREWLRRRTERGVFRQLLEELRLEDECNYRRYLRMDTETFQVRLNGFPYFVNTYSGCFGAFLNCERHFQIMVFMDIRNFSVQCNLCRGKIYLIVFGRAKYLGPEVTQASPSNAN